MSVTPIRRPGADRPERYQPRYTMHVDGRTETVPANSYVGALAHARAEATRRPGTICEVYRGAELIGRFVVVGGVTEGWVS